MEIEVKHNVVLAPLTTLKIGGEATSCIEIKYVQQLPLALQFARTQGLKFAFLGSGSNVLLRDEGYQGCMLLIRIKGITERIEGDTVYMTVAAGELLDDVVSYSVERGWWGIENLSAIPGTIGATPIQNVGAYGVEVSDVIDSVDVFDCESETFLTLSREECLFSYRDSIFKKEIGKKYIVTHVTFILSTLPAPRIEYRDLTQAFAGTQFPLITSIRSSVIAIREQKFPDWKVVGTAGSFFKNPIVTVEQYATLLEEYPSLPAFESSLGYMKISLGYVLDKILNLKGYCEGSVCLYEKQALVLIANTGAGSKEVKQFAEKIIERVQNKIGVQVEMEVTEIF